MDYWNSRSKYKFSFPGPSNHNNGLYLKKTFTRPDFMSRPTPETFLQTYLVKPSKMWVISVKWPLLLYKIKHWLTSTKKRTKWKDQVLPPGFNRLRWDRPRLCRSTMLFNTTSVRYFIWWIINFSYYICVSLSIQFYRSYV